jgi:hypothetical protein
MAGGFPVADGAGSARAAGVAASGAAAAASDRLCVNLAIPSVDPDEVGAIRLFSENDPGTVTGTPLLQSAECDDDYRLRVALDTVLDNELFNYAAQNTGKFNYGNTTMAATWNQGGWLTNSGGITTTTTGVRQRSYGVYQLHGTRRTFVEQFVSFSATSGPTNTSVNFGLFIDSAANPFAPTDGVYVSLTNGTWSLNGNYNGSTTGQSSTFTFTPTANRKYKFTLSISQNDVELWIDDVLYTTISKDTSNPQIFAATALPWAFRHAIVGGAAGAAFQCSVGGVFISIGGGGPAGFDPGVISNGCYGSYQGGSGGTMGSLASYANSANPTAAVPTNTTSTVLTGLGGQGWETDTLAVTTDGVIMSYQVPAVAVTNNARRLAIYGIKIDGYIQTALTGGGYNAQFALCFGHTAVSLATAEAATAKAPRRVPIGSHTVTSGAVALTQLATVQAQWKKPIIVNPGEFVAVAKKKVGTAPSAGVVAWLISLDYEWV